MSFRKLFDSQRYYPASFLFSAFLCFLSAVVLSLAFMSSQFWFCAWIGLIPLFFALEKKSLSKTFLLAYFTGVIFYVLTIYWIAYVTILGLILLVLYLAIYFGVFGVCVSVFSKDSSFLRSSFLISSSWIVLEFLRSRLLTGFGWVSLGYSQYKNLAIIQIADFGDDTDFTQLCSDDLATATRIRWGWQFQCSCKPVRVTRFSQQRFRQFRVVVRLTC